MPNNAPRMRKIVNGETVGKSRFENHTLQEHRFISVYFCSTVKFTSHK